MKCYDFINGEILLINKPYRCTSFDVVNSIRTAIYQYTGIDKIKIGHAGTLDPLATGLLIICTGKYTKKIEEYQSLDKEYTGVITLGATTPSGDLEHEINQTFDISNITEEQIDTTAKKFVGEIKQNPPAWSAKKIKGIRAYEYARKGEDVVIKPNKIFIKEFIITKIELPQVYFRIICSKGTYIRSLAIDFGEALNNGAYLSSLCRTKIGDNKLEDSYDLEELIQTIKESGNINKKQYV